MKRCCQRRDSLLHRSGRQIAHDEDLGNCPHALPCARGIVLAVRPWEDGNAHARPRDLHGAADDLPLRIGRIRRTVDLPHDLRHGRREDLLKGFRKRILDIGEHDRVKIRDDARHIARLADLDGTRARKVRRDVKRGRDLEQDCPVEWLEEVVLRDEGREFKAQIVSQTHL